MNILAKILAAIFGALLDWLGKRAERPQTGTDAKPAPADMRERVEKTISETPPFNKP